MDDSSGTRIGNEFPVSRRWFQGGGLVASIVACVALFAIGLSWWTLVQIELQTRENIGSSLQAVLQTGHAALRGWTDEIEQDLQSWAQSPNLRRYVMELLELPRDADSLLASPLLADLRDALHPVIRNHDIRNFHVLTPDYIDLANWDGEGVGVPSPLIEASKLLDEVFAGKPTAIRPYFLPAFASEGAVAPESKKLTIVAAAPIRNHFGKTVALLVFQLDPAQNFSRILNLGQLGKTGESFVFDQGARLLNESRFVSQLESLHLVEPGKPNAPPLELRDPGGDLLEGYRPALPRDRQPLTRAAALATAGQAGMDLDGFRDYRGVPSVAAWLWDENLKMGLAVKMDRSEAYRSFKKTRNLVLFTLGLLAFSFMGLAMALATSRERAFNLAEEMTTSLRASHRKLEDEVAERQQVARELEQALANAEQAQEKIDGILKSIAEGLVVTDTQNRAVLMNSAARDILNVSWLDAVDKPVDQAIGDPYLREKIMALLDKKTSGCQLDFEWPGADPKRPRVIRGRTSALQDKSGKEAGIILLLFDVTHEHEVDRMKSDFISTAAHELRAPLTSIQGFSEILLTRDDIRTEEKLKFLNYINRQAVHLANIVNDLLDVSRIESKSGFSLEPALCDIEETIKSVVPYFQEQSSKHKFELVLPAPGGAWTVDKEKIGQVLKNLLSNAVKYSPAGGPIVTKVEALDDCYEVSVEDRGMGMNPEQIERIFEKFYRGEASLLGIEGTGLGMTIVKSIVETHGGRVWVESERKKGTKVRFTIPKNLPSQIPPE